MNALWQFLHTGWFWYSLIAFVIVLGLAGLVRHIEESATEWDGWNDLDATNDEFDPPH